LPAYIDCYKPLLVAVVLVVLWSKWSLAFWFDLVTWSVAMTIGLCMGASKRTRLERQFELSLRSPEQHAPKYDGFFISCVLTYALSVFPAYAITHGLAALIAYLL